LPHVVTQTIGGSVEGPQAAIEHFKLFSGDRVLLCTNGLTDAVSNEEVADVLALQRHPEDDCRRLIELALDKGGPDNVTVVVAAYWIPSFTVESDPSRSGSPGDSFRS
jgi:protein phosphatase